MNLTTELLSQSLTRSIRGSHENFCAEVTLAKRSDGVHVAVRRDHPSRRIVKFSVGYARFAMPTVWIHKHLELIPSAGYLVGPGGKPLDLTLVEKYAAEAFAAADEVTALRKARATTV
jgi:hypothetical protein